MPWIKSIIPATHCFRLRSPPRSSTHKNKFRIDPAEREELKPLDQSSIEASKLKPELYSTLIGKGRQSSLLWQGHTCEQFTTSGSLNEFDQRSLFEKAKERNLSYFRKWISSSSIQRFGYSALTFSSGVDSQLGSRTLRQAAQWLRSPLRTRT